MTPCPQPGCPYTTDDQCAMPGCPQSRSSQPASRPQRATAAEASTASAGFLRDRHNRLAQAAQDAPHGQKLRLQAMTYAACHERMAAELAVSHD